MNSESSQELSDKSSIKVPSILLKADFFTKGRNLKFIKKHGPESILIIQAVWIASSQERECKILKEDAYNVPFLMLFSEDKVKQVLDAALKEGLINGDESHFWNSQVVENSQSWQKKHNNYKEASKKREKIKAESYQNPTKILTEFRQDYIDIYNDINNDHDLKKENKEIARTPDLTGLPPEEQEKFKKAEQMLESETDPRVIKSNLFLNCGRKPLKKWPEIWLTTQELVAVLDFWQEAGFEKSDKSRAFNLVQSRIKTKLARGSPLETISAFNWLVGFQSTEIITQIKAKNDKKRSEEYLNNALKG